MQLDTNKTSDSPDISGLIFDVQGYSVHDGPGCRTTVFLSGCPLTCSWCCNPEGMLLQKRLMYRAQRCKHCLRCIKACPQNSVSEINPEILHFKQELCQRCENMVCIENCFTEALASSGKYITAGELMDILNRDRSFWNAEGGVTFSGGEPLFQKDFIVFVLKKCRETYIHTAVETSGQVDGQFFLKASQWIDWMFFDIKHMNPQKHLAETGVDNKIILNNLIALSSSDWKGRMIIRIPLIPGYNDSRENIIETVDFVKKLGLNEINILPFHRLGNSKYEQLGLKYAFGNTASPTKGKMDEVLEWIDDGKMKYYIGYQTPF